MRPLFLLSFALLSLPSSALAAAGLPGTGCVFATIQGAIDAASPGDTVFVTDAVHTENLHITKDLTLVGGADPTCSGWGGSAVSTVEGGGGTLVFVDGVNNLTMQHFKITSGHDNNHGGNMSVYRSGDVLLEDVTLTEGSADLFCGGNLYVKGGDVELLDSLVSDGEAPQGGGICVTGGTVTLTNSEVIGNNADDGGGVYLAGTYTPVELIADELSQISSNTALVDGGGIYATGDTAMDGQGASMRLNEAGGHGGGVYYDPLDAGQQTQRLASFDIDDNTAGGDGGGVYLTTCAGCSQDPIVIFDVDVMGNVADNGAGMAVALDPKNSVQITQSYFGANVADDEGGGLWLASGTADVRSVGPYFDRNMSATMFEKNSARVRGGGVFSWGTLVLDRVVFVSNDTHNPNQFGPHEIGNYGTLDAHNVLVLGNGGMSVRTFDGGFSSYRHLTLLGGTNSATIVRFDPGSDGEIVASIVDGGRVREFISGSLDAPCTLFGVPPTGTYNAPDSCHGWTCDPNFITTVFNDFTPTSPDAVDACAAHSSSTIDLDDQARDADPDMGAFEL